MNFYSQRPMCVSQGEDKCLLLSKGQNAILIGESTGL